MKKDFLTSLLLLVLAACASFSVSDDSLSRRTADALSLSPENFAITSREDEGDRTSYHVFTDSGRSYDCTVSGSIGMTGRTLSDPSCHELPRPVASARHKARAAS